MTTDRSDWLDRRRSAIGASEAAALFDAHPWLSQYALWCDKRGLKPDEPQNEFMRAGIMLEPVVAAYYAEDTGRTLIDHGRHDWRRHPNAPLGCTLDREIVAIDERGPGALELKTAIEWKADDWKDGIPLEYQCQIQTQLAVTGWKWGSVAVLVGGHAFHWYDVERDDTFIAELEARAAAFWERVESGNAPEPDGSASTAAAIKARYPGDNGETVTLPPEAIEWDAVEAQASEEIDRWTAAKKEARAKLQNAIGGALFGVTLDGVKWKYGTTSKKSYVVAASEFRTLTRSKSK